MPLVPGSFAAWGRTFARKSDLFFEETTWPGQRSCPGQNFFPEIRPFFEQTTCHGQLRCLGQNFFSKIIFFETSHFPGSFGAWGSFFLFLSKIRLPLIKPLVWGSCVAGGRTFSQISDFFEQTTCLGQLRCLGQNFFLRIILFFN